MHTFLSESVTYKCGADPCKHKKTCPCKSLLGQVKYPAVPPGLVQKYTHSVRTDIRRPLFTERHLRLTYWVYPWHRLPDLKDYKDPEDHKESSALEHINFSARPRKSIQLYICPLCSHQPQLSVRKPYSLLTLLQRFTVVYHLIFVIAIGFF